MYLSQGQTIKFLALILLFCGAARSQEESPENAAQVITLVNVLNNRENLVALANKIKQAIKTNTSPEAQAWAVEPGIEEINSGGLRLVWLAKSNQKEATREIRAEITVTQYTSPEMAQEWMESSVMTPQIGSFIPLPDLGDKAFVYQPGGGTICFTKGSFFVSRANASLF